MLTKDDILTALKQVFDPEIGVNIVDLGLVYGIDLDEAAGRAHVNMTLTSFGCPMGPQMIHDVRTEVARLPDIKQVDVDLVWNPHWQPSMMSDSAKEELGYDEEMGLGYAQ
jgi:metal-sulfur cluster biosynthetic enzyme